MISSHLLCELNFTHLNGVTYIDSRFLAVVLNDISAFCGSHKPMENEGAFEIMQRNREELESVLGNIRFEEGSDPESPGVFWLTEGQTVHLAKSVIFSKHIDLDSATAEKYYNNFRATLCLALADYENTIDSVGREYWLFGQMLKGEMEPFDFQQRFLESKEMQCIQHMDSIMVSLIATLSDDVQERINQAVPESETWVGTNGEQRDSVRGWIAQMEAIKRYAPQFSVQADLAIRKVTALRGFYWNPETG